MRDRRIPSLPEMEGRYKEAVQAFGEIQEVFGRCKEELQQTMQKHQKIAEHREEVADWADQLQQVIDRDARHLEPADRQDLVNRLLVAQKTLIKLNRTLEAVLKEINDLNAAMIALARSPKKPEVAEG